MKHLFFFFLISLLLLGTATALVPIDSDKQEEICLNFNFTTSECIAFWLWIIDLDEKVNEINYSQPTTTVINETKTIYINNTDDHELERLKEQYRHEERLAEIEAGLVTTNETTEDEGLREDFEDFKKVIEDKIINDAAKEDDRDNYVPPPIVQQQDDGGFKNEYWLIIGALGIVGFFIYRKFFSGQMGQTQPYYREPAPSPYYQSQWSQPQQQPMYQQQQAPPQQHQYPPLPQSPTLDPNVKPEEVSHAKSQEDF